MRGSPWHQGDTLCTLLLAEGPWQGEQGGEELEEGEGETDGLVDQLRAEDADKSSLHALHFHVPNSRAKTSI